MLRVLAESLGEAALYARSAGKITRQAWGANKHRITGILWGADLIHFDDHQISESTPSHQQLYTLTLMDTLVG